MAKYKYNFSIAIIIAIVILKILYIVYVFHTSSSQEWIEWYSTPDTIGYIWMADDLADFSLDAPSYRTPGYSIILAALSRLSGASYCYYTIIVQQLVDGVTALLLYIIVKSKHVSYPVFPAVLYLLHPYVLSYSTLILPATITSLLLTLAIYVFMYRKKLTPMRAFAVGIILSAGAMVRPMLLYLPWLLLVYLLFVSIKHWKKVALPMLILAVSSALFPVLLKNYNKSKFDLNSLSTQGNFELAARMAVIGEYCTQEHVFEHGGFRDSLEALAMDNGSINYTKLDSIHLDTAKHVLLRNPLPIVKSHLFGWIGFLSLGNPQLRYLRLNEEQINHPYNRAIQIFILICTIIIYPGIAIGIMQKTSNPVKELSVIALMLFGYAAVIHAALCGPYYLLPFLAILLAAGYSGWHEYLSRRTKNSSVVLNIMS